MEIQFVQPIKLNFTEPLKTIVMPSETASED